MISTTMNPAIRKNRPEAMPSIVLLFSIALVLFHLCVATTAFISLAQQRGVHLLGFIVLWFLYRLRDSGASGTKRAFAISMVVSSVAVAVYFMIGTMPAMILEKGIMGITPLDVVFGVCLMLLVLELARETVGLALPIIGLVFISFAMFGPYMPEVIAHKGYDLEYITSYIAWTSEGIFGTPIGASASFVVLYIIFGELLDQFGAGKFFIDIAYSLTGRMRGGPAEASVLSSALMGSINGSAVANVVTTGTFTVPLMKKAGYTAEYAASVEAVASTGGQILPPVMGAAAFVMADMTGIPYSSIIIAALIPGLLYFLSLGLAVYFEARRIGLKADTDSRMRSLLGVLRDGYYHLIPLVILIVCLLGAGLSAGYSALFAIASMLIIGVVKTIRSERRFPWKELGNACVKAARTSIPVAAACAAAGIVIGIVSMTGIGVRFAQIVLELSGGKLFGMLLMIMIACIVLGMGLPSTAAYVIAATVGAPALLSAGIPALGANLFVFYFAIISFITPPVALASYAAAGIADANASKTGALAFKLGLAGFVIPFLYVYHPGLLILGTGALETLYAALLAVSAVTAMTAALEGWFIVPLRASGRVALAVSAALIVSTSMALNGVGFALAATVILFLILSSRRGTANA